MHREDAPVARNDLPFSTMAYYLACAVASIFMATALSATLALESQSGWALALLPGIVLFGMIIVPVVAFLFFPSVVLSAAIARRYALSSYRHYAALGALSAAGAIVPIAALLACGGAIQPLLDHTRITLLVVAEFVVSGLVAGVMYRWLAISSGRKNESAN